MSIQPSPCGICNDFILVHPGWVYNAGGYLCGAHVNLNPIVYGGDSQARVCSLITLDTHGIKRRVWLAHGSEPKVYPLPEIPDACAYYGIGCTPDDRRKRRPLAQYLQNLFEPTYQEPSRRTPFLLTSRPPAPSAPSLSCLFEDTAAADAAADTAADAAADTAADTADTFDTTFTRRDAFSPQFSGLWAESQTDCALGVGRYGIPNDQLGDFNEFGVFGAYDPTGVFREFTHENGYGMFNAEECGTFGEFSLDPEPYDFIDYQMLDSGFGSMLEVE